jgi:hypothetical protein
MCRKAIQKSSKTFRFSSLFQSVFDSVCNIHVSHLPPDDDSCTLWGYMYARFRIAALKGHTSQFKSREYTNKTANGEFNMTFNYAFLPVDAWRNTTD